MSAYRYAIALLVFVVVAAIGAHGFAASDAGVAALLDAQESNVRVDAKSVVEDAQPTPATVEETAPEKKETVPGWLPKLSATVQPAQAHIGDPIAVRITVSLQPHVSVNLPLELELGDFVELSRSEHGEKAGEKAGAKPDSPKSAVGTAGGLKNTQHKRIFEVKVATYKLGELTLPALDVTALGPNGELATLHTEPVPIRITSVMPNEPNPKLKSELAPVSVYRRRWWPLVALGGLLVLVIAVVITVLVYRRMRSRRGKPAVVVPRIPAHIAALEQLDQLDIDELLATGGIKALYIAISEIMRTYVGRRYGFDALEMTTTEINVMLQQAALADLLQERFNALFSECDLVKFAKFVPDEQTARAVYGRARSIVHDTAPHDTAPQVIDEQSAVSTDSDESAEGQPHGKGQPHGEKWDHADE